MPLYLRQAAHVAAEWRVGCRCGRGEGPGRRRPLIHVDVDAPKTDKQPKTRQDKTRTKQDCEVQQERYITALSPSAGKFRPGCMRTGIYGVLVAGLLGGVRPVRPVAGRDLKGRSCSSSRKHGVGRVSSLSLTPFSLDPLSPVRSLRSQR